LLNHRPEAVQVADRLVVDRQVADKGEVAKQEVDNAVADRQVVAKLVASPEVEPAGVAFSPQKPDPGRLPVSKRWESTKLNPGNSKSTEYWSSSTRASSPTSRGAKSASPPH
jgi:hypothetical protein